MDAVAETSKKLNTKIAFLCERSDIGPSELARIAGVTPASAAAYLRSAAPSAVALARIADHFQVSMRWFLDDQTATKQPQAEAERLSDRELLDEFFRRWDRQHKLVFPLFSRAKRLDWTTIAERLEEHDDLDQLPEELQAALRLIVELDLIGTRVPILTWSPGMITIATHAASELQEYILATPRISRLAMRWYHQHTEEPTPDPEVRVLREAVELCEKHFPKAES